MRGAPKLTRNALGYFEVRWREGGISRRRSLQTKDQTSAEHAFASFLLRAKPQTTYTVREAWQLREQETLSTLADPQRVRDCWKALLPFFGPIDIDRLTSSHVNDYVAMRLSKGRQASTARRELVELTATLNYLSSSRRVSSDRLLSISLPPEGAARPHYLSDAQCALVLAEAARRRTDPNVFSRLELFLWIGLHTGQRKRAIECLEWDQLDFQRGIIHFAKAGEVITKKRKGSVLMRVELRALLEQERASSTSSWVLRHPGSIRTTFETLMNDLGLPHVTPHVLRHTFVSQLLMRAVPVYTVSKLAAVSVKRIESTYGHLSDEHLAQALARV